jgi:hypothetical protein
MLAAEHPRKRFCRRAFVVSLALVFRPGSLTVPAWMLISQICLNTLFFTRTCTSSPFELSRSRAIRPCRCCALPYSSHIMITTTTYRSIRKGQMRLAGQASRSNKFAIFWAADNRNSLLLDLGGYPSKLALRIIWPSFGNATACKQGPVITSV